MTPGRSSLLMPHRKDNLQRLSAAVKGLNIFDGLVVAICAASFVFSVIESVVNYDNLHWGWAYIAALDLKRGAFPHSEVIIFYGYIYTLLQSFALHVFGERLISVGIVTGLFYSVTLLLSYRIFLRFLKKNLAFIAVLFIFLIHPYIIYPAPNYFAYAFQLLALLLFLKYPENRNFGLAAGFFLGMAVLSRYSSVAALVTPFIILLGRDFFIAKKRDERVIPKVMLVGSGFLIPVSLFLGYLLLNAALDDFFYQNVILVKTIGRGGDIETYANFLASVLQIVPSYASDFRGKMFTFILFICLLMMIRTVIRKPKDEPGMPDCRSYDILAVCLITVFGFLNSMHVYETFRLVNGVSLGVGLCVLVFYHAFITSGKPLKYILAFGGIAIFVWLSSSLLFKQTTSAYYPWQKDIFCGKGVANSTIPLLKGKILTAEYNDFYQEIYDAVEPYKKNYYIINYTRDLVAFALNDLPRIQISPVNLQGIDDLSHQAKLIEAKKAVILSYKPLDFPGYRPIFKKRWPDEIPWLGGGLLFIYAPQ